MSEKYTEEVALSEVRELVGAAVGILKKLGSEKERLAWMLEDTLSYLDEMKECEGLKSRESVIEYLEKLEDKAINS
jgi:hypothetical protein